jgi:hypothetical protein
LCIYFITVEYLIYSNAMFIPPIGFLPQYSILPDNINPCANPPTSAASLLQAHLLPREGADWPPRDGRHKRPTTSAAQGEDIPHPAGQQARQRGEDTQCFPYPGDYYFFLYLAFSLHISILFVLNLSLSYYSYIFILLNMHHLISQAVISQSSYHFVPL